jgi:hypothetical protein
VYRYVKKKSRTDGQPSDAKPAALTMIHPTYCYATVAILATMATVSTHQSRVFPHTIGTVRDVLSAPASLALKRAACIR